MADSFQLLLIAIGTNDADSDRFPQIAVSEPARELAELLTPYGAQVVLCSPPHDAQSVREWLDDWADPDRPAGNTLLYWAGHGHVANDHLWLVARNTSASRLTDASAVPARSLATYLRRDWERRSASTEGEAPWTAVILDCCGAGVGVSNLVSELTSRPAEEPSRLGLLGSAQDGASFTGRLGEKLALVLGSFWLNDQVIPLRELLHRLDDELRPGSAHRSFDLPPAASLPNPRHLGGVLIGTVDAVARLQKVLAGLPAEVRSHFVAKAQGAELNELAWYFQGRHRETVELADWLEKASGGVFVVTGRAGCGKSALLGRLVTLADRRLVEALREARLMAAPPPAELPPESVFDVIVHLTGRTVADTAAEIAVAIPGYSGSVGDVDAMLAALREQQRPFTVLVDALDEAVDPFGIAAAVLRRLAVVPGLRVVVGTRRSLKEGPDLPEPDDRGLLDALALDPQRDRLLLLEDEPDSIARYVEARLLGTERSPYREDAETARWLAHEVQRRGGPFLFARLATAELLARGRMEQGSVQVAELLDGGHRGLFARAMERFETEHAPTVALLQALAFAQGRGLPRRDRVWATAAQALRPATAVSEKDIDRTLELAAAYITLDGESGQSSYRLAHQTFVEHFLAEVDGKGQVRAHETVSAALLRLGREAGWDEANPYLLRYLAPHAHRGESLDAVLDEPAALDNLDQERLAAELLDRYFGRGAMPKVAQEILRGRHALTLAGPEDRPPTRHLAGLVNRQPASELQPVSARWWPRWVAGFTTPLHMTLSHSESGQSFYNMSTVAFGALPDGRLLVGRADRAGKVRLWDLRSGAALAEPFTDDPASATFVGALSDGRLVLASAGKDNTMRLWDPSSGAVLAHFTGNFWGVRAVAFGALPDGRLLLASAGDNRRVRVWDRGSGAVLADLTGHWGAVNAVAFGALPDGRVLLASASDDRMVRLWDPRGGAALRWPLTGHWGPVNAVAFGELPDRRLLLASAGDDGTVRIWDPSGGAALGEPLASHSGPVNAVAFGALPDGRLVLASAGDDGTVRLWDPSDRAALAEPLAGHSAAVRAVAFGELPDGRLLLASAGEDNTVRLWDPGGGAALAERLAGHSGPVRAVAFGELPDGRLLLASAGDDRTVRLWDPGSGAALAEPLTGHLYGVRAVAFGALPDGRLLLASAGDDGTVRLWDPSSRAALASLIGNIFQTKAVAFGELPEGHWVLAILSRDRTVRLWDPSSGAALADLTGHSAGPDFVGALSDGRLLFASAGRTVRLWDHSRWREDRSWRSAARRSATWLGVPFRRGRGAALSEPPAGHSDSVNAVAFGELDGRLLLASASNDSTVRLWDASGTPVLAERLAGHSGPVRAVAFGELRDGRLLLASAGKDNTVRLWDPSSGRAVAIIPTLDPVWDIALVTRGEADRGVTLLAAATSMGVVLAQLDV